MYNNFNNSFTITENPSSKVILVAQTQRYVGHRTRPGTLVTNGTLGQVGGGAGSPTTRVSTKDAPTPTDLGVSVKGTFVTRFTTHYKGVSG